MTAPAAALQKALFQALDGDGSLSAALGGAKLFDHAPENIPFPYVTFGRTSVYDCVTGRENDAEQLFTLHFWSKSEARKEMLDVMDMVSARLQHAALALDEHHRVNLRLEFTEVRYDEDLSACHGLLRFRAVTEENA
jgi:dsDNA-binding SOS-regulon protein